MNDNLSPTFSGKKIARLSDAIVNQIAAGEVVERPASVVKELVENCLDAFSTRIDILLKEGGKSEVGILDDGTGMWPEDLMLCAERHATSKISKAEDLTSLLTFGFRGEALSSIASVSEMEIKSRTSDMPGAFSLKIVHGTPLSEIRPVAGPVGTFVSVNNLFGNVPARKKFLRSTATELSHCSRVVKELALGAPHASFYLEHEKRLIQKYVAHKRESRFFECSRPAWEPLHFIETNEEITLEFFLSPPHLVQNRGELCIFVNGRSVKNRDLMSALRRTYSETLGPHHEPSGVVYLDIRKDWVDVNVHPQKLEVRCWQPERIYGWIRSALRKAISKSTSIRPYFSEEKEGSLPDSLRHDDASIESVTALTPAPTKPLHFFSRSPEIREPGNIYAERINHRVEPPPTPFEPDNSATPAQFNSLRYIGQTKASYLICEDEKGLVLIDQHALHEKIRFEQLKNNFRSGSTKSQVLLMPRIVPLPRDLVPILEENLAHFRQLGFDLEIFGDCDIAVKSTPENLDAAVIEGLLTESLISLRENEGTGISSLDQLLHPLFATLACHSVIRANRKLSPSEAETLVEGLGNIQEGWTCPHGRPILFRLSFHAIEKHFERTSKNNP